nr:PREDICTED: vitellogenin receptor-like [Bos indicus]
MEVLIVRARTLLWEGGVAEGLTIKAESRSPGPPEKCGSSEFQCHPSACLDLSLVCDGKRDCADGSDEGGQCSSSACRQGQCFHSCYPSPHGPVCACERGFELKSSGQICEDVDECQRLGGHPCSQTCVNTKGSYTCACHPGYSLEPDGHTCKAIGKCSCKYLNCRLRA